MQTVPQEIQGSPEIVAHAFRVVRECVDDTMDRHFPDDLQLSLGLDEPLKTEVKENILVACLIDAIEFARRDPASGGSVFLVRHAYSGFLATVGYRLANELHRRSCVLAKVTGRNPEIQDTTSEDEGVPQILRRVARMIAEAIKREYRVEIHPGASIGPGLLLDHARGVVIGETAVIGRNCCILQGVVLGAVDVNEAQAPEARRHPSIGDNVTICGNAMLFGAITVGNNVTIGPHVILREDVPDDMSVVIQAYVQYQRQKKQRSNIPESAITVTALLPPKIFGITPHSTCYDSCLIYGTGLAKVHSVQLVNPSRGGTSTAVPCEILERDDRMLHARIQVSAIPTSGLPDIKSLWLQLTFTSGIPPIYIRYHEGLRYFLNQFAAGRS